jgi:hypothetical protein
MRLVMDVCFKNLNYIPRSGINRNGRNIVWWANTGNKVWRNVLGLKVM